MYHYQNVEKKAGFLGILGESFMPKLYTSSHINNLMTKLVGAENYSNSTMCILYGSQKPYSDIDLFVVNDNINSFKNNWLDIYAMPQKEFYQRMKLHDISVTDPLFTGEVLIGENFCDYAKKELIEQPITKKSITFNQTKSQEQDYIAKNYNLSSRDLQTALQNATTYHLNSLFLQNGEKKFTKQELI